MLWCVNATRQCLDKPGKVCKSCRVLGYKCSGLSNSLRNRTMYYHWCKQEGHVKAGCSPLWYSNNTVHLSRRPCFALQFFSPFILFAILGGYSNRFVGSDKSRTSLTRPKSDIYSAFNGGIANALFISSTGFLKCCHA